MNNNFTPPGPSSPINIPNTQTPQARKQRQQEQIKAKYEEIIGNRFEMKFGQLRIRKETDQNDDFGNKRENFYNSFKKQMIAIIVDKILNLIKTIEKDLKELNREHQKILEKIQQNDYEYINIRLMLYNPSLYKFNQKDLNLFEKKTKRITGKK